MTKSQRLTVQPGPWQMREAMTLEKGDVLYVITRVVNRRRVHLEYASNGKPMLWCEASARAAIVKALGEQL